MHVCEIDGYIHMVGSLWDWISCSKKADFMKQLVFQFKVNKRHKVFLLKIKKKNEDLSSDQSDFQSDLHIVQCAWAPTLWTCPLFPENANHICVLWTSCYFFLCVLKWLPPLCIVRTYSQTTMLWLYATSCPRETHRDITNSQHFCHIKSCHQIPEFKFKPSSE